MWQYEALKSVVICSEQHPKTTDENHSSHYTGQKKLKKTHLVFCTLVLYITPFILERCGP